ncbi:unnamed protein product, partial [Mesorhabditis spiculigera]
MRLDASQPQAMSSAEQLAAEFEQDGGPDVHEVKGEKRTKNERAGHKHTNPDDTRKFVQNAMNGEQKRHEAPPKN